MSGKRVQKNHFQTEKTRRLNAKQDLSLKGSIDEPIVDLISALNSCGAYYTTSSCSGRITVMADNSGCHLKKSVSKWLFISHDVVDSDEVMSAIRSGDDRPLYASFKVEPFVLHVCADGLSAAKRLLEVAIGCGFRNSGLTISKSDRIIVAVRSCHSLEVPIICDKELIVTEDYMKYITEVANQKMRQNFEKINKFYSMVKSLCDNLNNGLSVE
ncbi:unnamed protein product [Oppiella nova]|uniref:tRNA wybutosine-synthesizing protein 3 homolog n=1 Tax=Oppiella nova TaxID=334625 RepID=A0A7R9MFC3_9ACAR|nr:unnamed protein product [Oppiella nova]CAG2176346.1 unnamed protein product [Oppiella nova]